jgi:hypothetical protein
MCIEETLYLWGALYATTDHPADWAPACVGS